MNELLTQLGIDWRLLLSQAANFLILLFVLRFFAYGPVMKMLRDRRMKIEGGLENAKEADLRLLEANEMMKEKLKEAEQASLAMLRETEVKSKELEARLLETTHEKEAAILENAEEIIRGKAEEARQKMRSEAVELVRAALIRAVEMDPKAVDEALIRVAVGAG